MKRKHRKIPYTLRIAVVIILFTLLPCILLEGIYLRNKYSDWKDDIFADYQSDADSGALLVSQNITGLQSKMQYTLTNFEIRSYLSQVKSLSLLQALDFIYATEVAVDSLTADKPNLEIRWYPHESTISYGQYCYTLERFAEEFPQGAADSCYQEILALSEGSYLWKVRDISRQGNNRGCAQTSLCLYTQMESMSGPDCILEFSIPISDLAYSRKSATIQDSLFAISLIQDDNAPVNIPLSTTLSTLESEELFIQYHKNQAVPDYEIISAPIPNVTGGEVLVFIPKTYISALILPKIVGFLGISALVALLILVTCCLTSQLLTRRTIRAIDSMNNNLKSLLAENAHEESVQDDFDQIALQVQKLVQDTQEYYLKIERYETENLRMELELLQMRFNPHLLYNTLDAIYHQIKNPDARRSIDSLCNYYRIVLNNGHLIICIKDEIEMIKDYLSIVKFAYGLDDVTYEFNIEDQVAQYTIIKHLLQPIVENAINHGLRASGHDGILRIHAFSKEEDVCIQVSDNGVGMNEEAVRHLLTEPSASVSGGGYGIYNVQQRIQVYYGREYGLEIASTPGTGTTVTMRIPQRFR